MRGQMKQYLYISCLKFHKPFNMDNKERKTRAHLKQEWLRVNEKRRKVLKGRDKKVE